MFTMALRITILPEKTSGVIAIFNSISGPLESDPSCKSFTMLSNVKNDDLQVLFGIWESKEALEDHIRSNDFKKIMAIMEMSDETPEIRFSKVSDIGGVDLIEKLRGE